MRFILLRHEQTQWNLQGRLQGWLDSQLTPEGVARLQQVTLPVLDSPMIISSDLGRAVDSARIIGARLGAPVAIDPRLRERRFGILEGQVVDSSALPSACWLAYHRRYVHKMDGVEGVESERDFERRITEFLSDISQNNDSQDIVLISHGEFIRAFMNIINKLDSWRYGQGIIANGSPVVVHHSSEWAVSQ